MGVSPDLAALETLADTVRITEVKAIPFALPYRRVPEFASGRVASADNVLVRVHTDAGLIGQAEAQPRPYTYGETQTTIVDAVDGPLNEALTGVDPLRTELVADRCAALTGNYVARGAVDLAVWDLVGQILGCPCHTLLGGFAAGVAAAHMVSLAEPAAMAEEAVAVNEHLGVETFKVKVGRAPELDVAAVRAVREALPGADLYVDANRGWSYDDAVRAGEPLIELGVRAIEEPISVDDRAGRLRLAERWSVPIGGDESCISLGHVDRALEEGAVRVVSIKTARTGFTESRRILDLCLARAVPVVVGSQYEGAIGAVATITFAAAFAATAGRPAEITNFLDLGDDLLVAAPEIRDGRAPAPSSAGLGLEVDEDQLQRYRLDR
jgi:L-Ala-D/L-Glu epimerase